TNKLREILCQITLKTRIDVNVHKITNHSARRTVIIILKASDIPENEIMCFSGHKSHEGVKTYSKPTDNQQLRSMATLILYTTIGKNLEEFYSYLGNLYTHKSDSEDNNNNVVSSNYVDKNNMNDKRVVENEYK
ncbi:35976_t:CDS:1, partial [Racocetra persica]